MSYNTGSPCNWTTNQRITYTYDMFNNLIGRTVTTYDTGGETSATTQRYVFDGTNMVLAFDGSGNLTDRYLWGPAVDQVLADENYRRRKPGEARIRLPTRGHDALGVGRQSEHRRDVVNDSGTLEQHIAYSPFGQQVTVPSTVSPSVADFVFGYTGTYTDPVTGLQLHGVRWYDPDAAMAEPRTRRRRT